ncbi:hypothetical protein KRE47_08725 [Elizabethkingia meningoseptica]|uniref:hypothetical protein n=1 Tax=Elizabethkingia meningoseptica TaxID=238 RepID=UPI000841EA27|nr:hypothetical protein [Elizabethkingia meningoseptica]EJK5329763.1 hypothetical protein [Elizabethkingia meningoseptica]MDE5469122.1 hypothetical protein [Elizabethkingia meningoseptica]MDE5475036.1 hypothetical protein [Elizabethkingia meningoseptica]MDE5478469.1 hypothetical protein [Elizabethkingia meningoseptica]MDE5486163.1 hypothetical protein [Elizabethkingia meningoseptica]
MKKKYKYLILSVCVIGIVLIIVKFSSFLLSIKLQGEIPKIYENTFAKKENGNHIFSIIYKDRYPVSFYRVPDQYDFVIYSFKGSESNRQGLNFTQSNNPLISKINKVSEATDFMVADVNYYFINQDKNIASIRVNGTSVKKELREEMCIYETAGNYEIFFNNKRAFFVETNLRNHIFIKNEGDFYQICILEVYNAENEKQIVSRFKSY